jgi:hypothetical protein
LQITVACGCTVPAEIPFKVKLLVIDLELADLEDVSFHFKTVAFELL